MLRGTRPLLARAIAPKRAIAPSALLLSKSPSTISPLPRATPSIGTWGRLPAALPRIQRSQYATIPNKRDVEFEKETAKKKLEARPEEVSVESSVRHVFEETAAAGQEAAKDEQDVLKGVKQDLVSFSILQSRVVYSQRSSY